jgi:hypothetical protein
MQQRRVKAIFLDVIFDVIRAVASTRSLFIGNSSLLSSGEKICDHGALDLSA